LGQINSSNGPSLAGTTVCFKKNRYLLRWFLIFKIWLLKGVANAANVARMTDVSGYTGSHKERFDETGKGKGAEGRADRVQNTGYVGNYKNAGTYDKKH
jgi:hypothetical protein